MDNIVNKKLYKIAYDDAKLKFKRFPSAYASMYIQKKYQQLGGTYKNKKPSKNSTTQRWLKEKWVQVIPYLTNGQKIVCGADNKDTKVCRPLIRINKQTPITLPELLKLHSKSELLKLARKKNRDMKGRVYWKTLKYIPSK